MIRFLPPLAHKPRLEFPGAIYDGISRGNYRNPIFEGDSGLAFEKALIEACDKCGWLLHACMIMNKHDHLALPQGGFSGLRWREEFRWGDEQPARGVVYDKVGTVGPRRPSR